MKQCTEIAKKVFKSTQDGAKLLLNKTNSSGRLAIGFVKTGFKKIRLPKRKAKVQPILVAPPIDKMKDLTVGLKFKLKTINQKNKPTEFFAYSFFSSKTYVQSAPKDKSAVFTVVNIQPGVGFTGKQDGGLLTFTDGVSEYQICYTERSPIEIVE